MNRRKGTSLVEVLVAIFIMAIGALAILAMFPLGVVAKDRAIQADRTAHSASNARSLGEALNIRFDNVVTPNFDLSQSLPALFSAPTLDTAGYPVYVDPIGVYTYSAPTSTFLGGTNIPRCSLSAIDNVDPTLKLTPAQILLVRTQSMLKWCTLQDDITFAPNALADLSSGTVDREMNYSWAWMIRRPKHGVSGSVDVSVVVYSQRRLNTSFPSAAKETPYNATFMVDAATGTNIWNKITLTWSAGTPQPRVEEGGWLLDATPGQLLPLNKPLLQSPGNSSFYRVVSVSDPYTNATGNAIDVELALPVRGFPNSYATGPLMVVMEGVVEVMQMSGGWSPWSGTSK